VLLSMTGFGEGRIVTESIEAVVEIRALNNRYLKLTVRANEPYGLLQPVIDHVVRKQIRRGTIQVQLRVHRQPEAQDYRLNTVALRSYLDQARQLQNMLDPAAPVHLRDLLILPGAVLEPRDQADHLADDWRAILPALEQALERLQAMRREEGAAMQRELEDLAGQAASRLQRVQERAPEVVIGYRDKLRDRVRELLDQTGIPVSPADLIKEVSIFAERSDIREEIVRLASHLEQFRQALQETISPGRKLDFLVQEMVREVNTMGTKANDVLISQHVVELKGILDRMRELVQNVE